MKKLLTRKISAVTNKVRGWIDSSGEYDLSFSNLSTKLRWSMYGIRLWLEATIDHAKLMFGYYVTDMFKVSSAL